MPSRRSILKHSLAALTSLGLEVRSHAQDDLPGSIETAHREIWRRFIDKHQVMIDFTMLDGSVSIPTPEECRLGKPNALGWWSPIENGAMFNGLYMDAAVNRWRVTHKDEDADKARKLAEGLMFLSSLSDVKGFVARGVSTDDRSHYPMGSNDQTLPWFLGLWRYLGSGLAGKEERRRVIAKMVETAEAIISLKWQMPAEPPFGIRGGFGGFTFESAPRLLFVTKALHQITGDPKWDTMYHAAVAERGGRDNRSRLELCEQGMVFESSHRHSWTSSCCVGSIRALWEMEADEALHNAYAIGLEASARLAMESLPLAQQFRHDDPRTFDPDWRKLNDAWKPQATEKEAQEVAEVQSKNLGKLAPRRTMEFYFMREPVFAAWIVTLAPDKTLLQQRRPEIEKVLRHYRCDQIYYSQFFPIESAWWRLQLRD
ncbi:MAG: hypothetical protein JWO94_2288 [Verrucomicrobiaceae bacterium]|nr:hypothetical protein [Verrucomicrobiaceae bacterium]